MRGSTTLYFIFLLLCAFGIASPTSDRDHDRKGQSHRKKCLSKSDVERIEAIWFSFFVVLDKSLAEKSVTDDFQLFSDSTNNFIGKPVRFSHSSTS